MTAVASVECDQTVPSGQGTRGTLAPVVVLSDRARRARHLAWLLENFSGRDLRELASLCDLRDKRRRNQWLALWAGPPYCDPQLPLPELEPEVLKAAMSYLAWQGWSEGGLLRAAGVYNAGRLGPWVVQRVVREVIRRREQGAL